MPGIGVTCDANPATRIMFYDDFTGPDNQPTVDGYEYDYDKIWATMGRNGINGVQRNSFVIEGDPPGWPVLRQAESIQQWDGLALAFVGVEYWNTVNAYNPWVNNLAGDRVIFGATAPSNGAFLHLGAATATNPVFTVKVLTSAAGVGGTWSAPITPIKSPDFTQAGGYKNQKCEFPFPITWPELVFGTAGPGGVGESRWYWCIELVTPAVVNPQSNVNYKDWVYGYEKYYGCACELRHGDDGTGTSSSDFRHEGCHHIRFRTGPGRFWNNRINTGKVQIGTYDGSANRTGVRAGWCMSCSRPPTIRPAELFGGLILGVPDNPVSGASVLGGDTTSKGRLVGVTINGFANLQLGSIAGPLKKLDDVRVSKAVSSTSVPAIQAIRMVTVTNNPATDRIFVDVTPGAGTQWAFRTTDLNLDPIVGLVIGGDDVSVAQIYRNTASVGKWNFIRLLWGGPNKKWGSLNAGGLAQMHEFLYLTWRGFFGGGAPAANIVVRATDSTGFKQILGTLDSGGRGGFNNQLSFAPVVGTIAKDLFCVEDGGDGTTLNPLVRDGNMVITVNPADEVGYNSAYQTLEWVGKFARRYEYDSVSDAYAEHDWQRQDMEVQFFLPFACPTVPPPAVIRVSDIPVEAEDVQRTVIPLPVST